MLSQTPLPTQGQLPWRHPQSEVGDEGRLGQLHVKGHLLGSVCVVDSPRGDNIVSKARGDLAADLGAVDLNAIDDLQERAVICFGGTRPSSWLLPFQAP